MTLLSKIKYRLYMGILNQANAVSDDYKRRWWTFFSRRWTMTESFHLHSFRNRMRLRWGLVPELSLKWYFWHSLAKLISPSLDRLLNEMQVEAAIEHKRRWREM